MLGGRDIAVDDLGSIALWTLGLDLEQSSTVAARRRSTNSRDSTRCRWIGIHIPIQVDIRCEAVGVWWRGKDLDLRLLRLLRSVVLLQLLDSQLLQLQ